MHASYVVCCVALRTEHFQHAARQPLYVAMMLSLQLGLLYNTTYLDGHALAATELVLMTSGKNQVRNK